MDPQSESAAGAAGSRRFITIAAATAAIAVCAFGWTATFWFRHHPHLPWQDLFVVWSKLLPLLDGDEVGRHALVVLLEPHYGAHRILLPRLLVALDVLGLHGKGHALYASGWAGVLALWAMFAATAARLSAGDRAGSLFGTALAGIMLFAPPGAWNLANPINCSWHLGLALALGAFLLALAGRRQGLAAWTAAYALATLAALTNFSGVIAWLLLPLIAILLGWRAIASTSVASGLLALLYLQGISSDAAIAMRWEHGDPQAAAALRTFASEALARNDLQTILAKTVRFLGWPLASSMPLSASMLVGGSFLLVLAGAISWLHGWRRRAEAAPWLMFSVVSAGLCIGIAIATQLGRVIEQPNYAHGPSFERYQTVVSVYWSACAMLALVFARALRPRMRTLAWGGSLAVALAVGAPGSDCLQQEVQSAEYAARLYLLGERPEWREPQDPTLLRYRPEFVFSFDEVMARRELAYRSPAHVLQGAAIGKRCDAIDLRISTVAEGPAGSVLLSGDWPTWHGVAVRGLLVYADGRPIGRMYAHHTGSYTPADLLSPASTRWEGIANAGAIGRDDVEIAAETPFGLRLLCTHVLVMKNSGS